MVKTDNRFKILEETYFKGRQSLEFKGIYNFNGNKIKIAIDHDSVSFQSSAYAHIWKDDQWSFIDGIHHTQMAVVVNKVPIYLNVDELPIWVKSHYRLDINTLKQKVKNILL